MPRYFTHYWKNSTYSGYREAGLDGSLLDFIVSNLFSERGVSSGDVVYIVSVFQGTLCLVGKLLASGIWTPEAAAAVLNLTPEDLYDGADVIIANAATPMNYSHQVPEGITAQLRFVPPSGEPIPLAFVSSGRLDTQTLRGVRELTPDSARLLDSLLPAMTQLPWNRGSALLPEEENTGAEETEFTYPEGALLRITVNAYERDDKAREACIAHHGTSCAVCGFSFQDFYGALGSGFIHVHHLKPLSQVGEGYQVDPVADLRPVCANCHAMLHRRNPLLSIEQLRQCIQADLFFNEEDEIDRANDDNGFYTGTEGIGETEANPEDASPGFGFLILSIPNHLMSVYIQPGRMRRLREITVVAGDLHEELGLSGQIRNVCRLMDWPGALDHLDVTLIERSGRHLGADATWRLRIAQTVSGTSQ